MKLRKRVASTGSQQPSQFKALLCCWKRGLLEPHSIPTASLNPSAESLQHECHPSEPVPVLEEKPQPKDRRASLRQWEPSQYPRPARRRSSDSSIFTALESVWDTRPISTDTNKTTATFVSAKSSCSAPPPKKQPQRKPKPQAAQAADTTPVIHFNPSPLQSPRLAGPASPRSPVSPTTPPELPARPPPPLSPQEVDDFCCQLVREPAFVDALRTSIPTNPVQQSYEINTQDEPELFYPALFHSVAICDAKISGLPVRQKSRSFHLPHRGMVVGECEFLNLTHTITDDFAVSMLTDPGQRPQFFLEYKINIKAPRQKRTAYVLASQMDFTSVVRQLAMHVLYSQPLSSSAVPLSQTGGGTRSALSQALYNAVNRPYHSPYVYISPAPTDWLELAMDMRNLELLDAVGMHSPKSDSPSPLGEFLHTQGARSALSNLHELLLDIRYLHRDVLLLRPSETYQNWEIVFTSPSLQTSAEEMGLCLTGSDPDSLQRLGVKLSKRQRCTENVRWGKERRDCRLYCVPMDGPHGSTHARDRFWVCWLVARSVPDLWEL